MANLNDSNHFDKRLNQDRIERENKATASSGMLLAVVLIAIAIIAAIYMMYFRTPEVTTNVIMQPTPVTNTETSTAVQPAETTTPATTETTTSTTTTPTNQ